MPYSYYYSHWDYPYSTYYPYYSRYYDYPYYSRYYRPLAPLPESRSVKYETTKTETVYSPYTGTRTYTTVL